MIGTRTTTAMVVALAAVATLGTLATIGNQAVFAQTLTQTNSNTNTQTVNLDCSRPVAPGLLFSTATTSCSVSQEQGNCQFNVGANDQSDATGDFESEDCS